MKIVFENKNTGMHIYPVFKQTKIIQAGRSYTRIAKSCEKHNDLGWYISKVARLIGKLFLGVLVIGLPFAFKDFRKSIKSLSKEISHGEEKTIHYIATNSTETKIHAYLEQMINAMKFETARSNLGSLHSVKCFIKIDLDKKEVKKEFILANDDETFLTENSFNEILNKMMQVLEKELTNLGSFKRDQWVILLQSSDRFHGAQGYKAIKENGNSKAEHNNSCNYQELYQRYVVNEMQFPKEQPIQNGRFVPGVFYQELAN